MKKVLNFEYEEVSAETDLPAEITSLIPHAQKAMESAYAPYSGFKVGCALLLDNGSIVLGSNQENAAYPAGLCAERVALSSAKVNYPGAAIKCVVICAETNNKLIELPISPCGGCRQVFVEVANRQSSSIKLVMYGTKKVYVLDDVTSLMPLSFTKNNL